MFFNRNVANTRRVAATDGTLSTRVARLVRESWWLLIVAFLAYLGLILASYTSTDPGWSFSGTGAPLGNRGGPVGAWVADLLLYLFGVWAGWWVVGGVVLVVAGFRLVIRPEEKAEHPLLLGVIGFALVLFSSAALEPIRLCKISTPFPPAPGGAFGDLFGQGAARALGFNGATLLLLVLVGVGMSLLFGISWLKVMERIGAGIETLVARGGGGGQ